MQRFGDSLRSDRPTEILGTGKIGRRAGDPQAEQPGRGLSRSNSKPNEVAQGRLMKTNSKSHTSFCLAALGLALIVAISGTPGASEAIAQGPTFSVDFQGPTAGFVPGPGTGVPDAFFGAPIDEGQILTTGVPGPFGPNPPVPGPIPLAPGIMADSVSPSPVGSWPGGLAITPSAVATCSRSGTSTRRYLPPKQIAGLQRVLVRGAKRVP